MTLASSDVPQASASRRLTQYPNGQLSSAPDRTTAALSVAPGGAAPAAADRQEAAAPASVLPRGADRWTQALTNLVSRPRPDRGFRRAGPGDRGAARRAARARAGPRQDGDGGRGGGGRGTPCATSSRWALR